MRKTTQGNATHLCEATQPDGRMQRCIRFEGHDGPHQTFVAEWSEGDVESRRRQYRPRSAANTHQQHRGNGSGGRRGLNGAALSRRAEQPAPPRF